MRSRLLQIFILFLLFDIKAQTNRPFSIGLGFSSTLPYQPDYWSDQPSIHFSPYLDIKFKEHEVMFGPDFYFLGPLYDNRVYPLITGGQGEYRYHFLKDTRKCNLFLNSRIQYVQFNNGCGLYPTPFNKPYPFRCVDGYVLQTKSIINTYGVGLEFNFLKHFYLYSTLGLGFNFSSFNYFGDNYRIDPLANVRIGLSFTLFKNRLRTDLK